jgi:hypothetical protein
MPKCIWRCQRTIGLQSPPPRPSLMRSQRPALRRSPSRLPVHILDRHFVLLGLLGREKLSNSPPPPFPLPLAINVFIHGGGGPWYHSERGPPTVWWQQIYMLLLATRWDLITEWCSKRIFFPDNDALRVHTKLTGKCAYSLYPVKQPATAKSTSLCPQHHWRASNTKLQWK